jgi:hypothetical protein
LYANEQDSKIFNTFLISPPDNDTIAFAGSSSNFSYSFYATSCNIDITELSSKGPNLNLEHLDYRAGMILDT